MFFWFTCILFLIEVFCHNIPRTDFLHIVEAFVWHRRKFICDVKRAKSHKDPNIALYAWFVRILSSEGWWISFWLEVCILWFRIIEALSWRRRVVLAIARSFKRFKSYPHLNGDRKDFPKYFFKRTSSSSNDSDDNSLLQIMKSIKEMNQKRIMLNICASLANLYRIELKKCETYKRHWIQIKTWK